MELECFGPWMDTKFMKIMTEISLLLFECWKLILIFYRKYCTSANGSILWGPNIIRTLNQFTEVWTVRLMCSFFQIWIISRDQMRQGNFRWNTNSRKQPNLERQSNLTNFEFIPNFYQISKLKSPKICFSKYFSMLNICRHNFR